MKAFWMEVIPSKMWYKHRFVTTDWRYNKTYVHRTISGKGIVGRLIKRRK